MKALCCHENAGNIRLQMHYVMIVNNNKTKVVQFGLQTEYNFT